MNFYRLRSWIDPTRINIGALCFNPHDSALYIIKANMDMIEWEWLSANSNDIALDILDIQIE